MSNNVVEEVLLPSEVITFDGITGDEWQSTTLFISESERVLMPYFGIVLQVDAVGILDVEFSVDNINFSKYPVNGFRIASGINEVHGAYKGSRYIRVRFTGETPPTFFRLLFDYSAVPVNLIAPVNQAINSDQDATVNRSILEGNQLNDLLETTDNYAQVGVLSNNALSVGLAPAILVLEDVVIPTGADFTIDPVFNAEANCYDSGWIPSAAYHSQLFHGKLDGVADVYLMNSPDTLGTNFTGGNNPFATTNAFGPTTGGAMFQQSYFRVVVKNTSGVTVSGQIESQGHFTQLGSILAPLSAPLFDFFPAPLTQTVTKGRQPDGDYVATPADGAAYEYNTDNGDAALLAGEEIESPWIDTDGFKEIGVFLSSDVVGTLIVEYTADANAATPIVAGQPEVYEYDAGAIAAGQIIPKIGTRLDGVRFRYENGDDDQTRFLLGVDLRNNPTALPQATLGGALSNNSGTVTTKGGLVAADDSESYLSIGRDGEGASLNTHITDIDAEVEIEPVADYQTGQVAVGTATAAQIPAPSLLSKGRSLTFTNTSEDNNLYWGRSTVTATSGDVVLPLNSKDLEISAANPPYVIMGGASGTTNTVTLDPDTVDSSSGLSTPSDMFTSNDARTDFDSTSDTATLSGFDATAGVTLDIQTVRLLLEGRKEPSAGTETALFSSATSLPTNGYADSTSLTISSVPLTAGGFYLVSVACRDENADVTNVTSTMGFSGFSIVGDTALGASESRTVVIAMQGTPTSAGTITVQFDTGFDHAAASVTVFTGTNSVTSTDTFASSTSNSFSGSVNGTNQGLFFIAIGSEITTVSSLSAPSGSIQRHESGSTSGNDQTLHIRTAPITATGAVPFSGTMSGTSDVTCVALALEPSDAVDPVMLVSHSEGSTTLEVTLTATSDTTFEADITADATWTEALIDGMTVTISPSLIGSADAQIDHVAVEVVEASDTTRITYAWVGDS